MAELIEVCKRGGGKLCVYRDLGRTGGKPFLPNRFFFPPLNVVVHVDWADHIVGTLH